MDALHHRGPDARGLRELDGPGLTGVLGHTRLRIIDLSSEAGALVAAGLAGAGPDREALAAYLLWGVVPGPRTTFADVAEVAPGSYLLWDRGREETVAWWTPEQDGDGALARGAERLLRAALRDATARHLVADRPVGVFLSAGTDSAAVATLAAAGGELRTLTVTFPDETSDEGAAASALAERLGARHECVPVTGADAASALPDILAGMDQPTADGVNTWVVCRAAREAGLVVVLSGLGGDELFGGYASFRVLR